MNSLAAELLNNFNNAEAEEDNTNSEAKRKTKTKTKAKQVKPTKLKLLRAGAIKVRNSKANWKQDAENIIKNIAKRVDSSVHYNFIEVFGNESNCLLLYYIREFAKHYNISDYVSCYVNDEDNTTVPKIITVTTTNEAYEHYLDDIVTLNTDAITLFNHFNEQCSQRNVDTNNNAQIHNIFILDTQCIAANVDIIMFYIHNANEYLLFKNASDKCPFDVMDLYGKLVKTFNASNTAQATDAEQCDVDIVYKSANEYLYAKI